MQFQPQIGKPIPVTGSGFVVYVENGVAYVATNNHVVSPMIGAGFQAPPQVVFHSGTPDELVSQAVARAGLTPTRPAQLTSQLGISASTV